MRCKWSSLSQQKKRCVLIDPGRGDLLYCMSEMSTSADRCIYRYSCKNKQKELRTGHYKAICERVKDKYRDEFVKGAEIALSGTSCAPLNIEDFIEYLKMRVQVAPGLCDFYEKYMTDPTVQLQRRESGNVINSVKALRNPVTTHPLHCKLRLSAYINQQQLDKRLVRNICKKFSRNGKDPVLVMGNWSAPMTCFHEMIKGVGMKRML
ncbi:hypothetical protein COEREDRAFT_40903 [Coemansia reversa NRRL 1564]|uniref:Uncharacterized protein n=1 Tax=Coemansia reversa (strain ATCC 12441 / NRRL 1564) TaxID=763665 RepID=A0A2G5BFK9_COERN|nr:hypothetical protein COEREDRAFT_40903 [Coemansia reversa NRRL 1564]|eukprot:PIA17507.1 hypothetical protein COEREDRAFT_40903 [Coemansia reversa NRRL 1564]